jgi:tRNA/rRNA methyltransferase
MEISFILYKPAVPGNVGAAARALKTMGFTGLRLIQPCNHLSDEARKFAHGSGDILENALVFNSFEDAVDDLDLIVCTTSRERSAKFEYHSSRELRGILEQKAAFLNHAGILFGTEESGLPNRLVLRSDLAVSIPMHRSYPSLNLAQSVMLIGYELSPLNFLSQPGKEIHKTGEGWAELKRLSEAMLLEAGIKKGSPLYHRIMERLSTIGSTDIPLFLSVLSRINDQT